MPSPSHSRSIATLVLALAVSIAAAFAPAAQSVPTASLAGQLLVASPSIGIRAFIRA